MIKNIIILIVISCCFGCAYVSESGLRFTPVNGFVFAEERINSSNFLLRILASDNSETKHSLFYHKIKTKGPYTLHLKVRDGIEYHNNLIIHSIIFKSSAIENDSKIEFQNGLTLEFEKAVNVKDELLGWDINYLFKEFPIDIPFVETQRLIIKFNISIISNGNNQNIELEFPFNSELIDHSRLVLMSHVYGH